jgi:hypothetical protein
MDKKKLQLYSIYLVSESSKSKQTKIQLLRFIENEATEHQLMSFILDGQIIKIDELSKQIIEDRLKASNVIKEIKSKIKEKIKK